MGVYFDIKKKMIGFVKVPRLIELLNLFQRMEEKTFKILAFL